MQHILCDGGKAQAGINDDNNCTVRALAITAGISYKKADAIATEAGRKRNEGFEPFKLMRSVRKNGIKARKICCGQQSLKQFLKSYPKGRYWTCTTDHAFAIIDGVIYDTLKLRPQTKVVGAFKIPSQRLDLIKSRLV